MKIRHLTLAALAMVPVPALAGPVTIDLSGIRAGTGDLYVSLQTADEFMRPTGSYGDIIRKPAAGSRTVTFENVTPGTYAANIWHDVNGNGKFDSAPDGRPLDGWSTLNAEKIRAKPRFEEVSFPVSAEATTLKLGLRYGE